MPTPFDGLGYAEAQLTVNRAGAASVMSSVQFAPIVGTGVADSTPRQVGISSAPILVRRMLDGDHWLDGLGWIGPRPGPNDDGYGDTMALLRQGFVSQNTLAEVIDRHVAGVLGMDPHWSFTPRRGLDPDEDPNEQEAELINEAEAAVTTWWDVRKVHKMLQQVARTLLYARRAPFRLFVPRGKLRATNIVDGNNRMRTVKVVDAASVEDGLLKIYPDAPLPEHAAVVEDPDTREFLGVVLYTFGQNVMGTGAPNFVAELTYLAERNVGDGDPLTVIRQTGQRSSAAERSTVLLDFGGRLAMFEVSREPFVTPQMIQMQRALNLAMSALPRNVITGGWLERVITNAQMPGKFVPDATKASGKRWVPDRHLTGGGATTYLKGLKNIDQSTGAESYATPAVNWRTPTDVAPTVEAQEALYRGILREAKQEHALMSQDVKASGKSREQARADFEMTLQPTAAELNLLGRWLLETVLAMAEAFAGTPGHYTDQLRAVFECVIDSGPITAQERTGLDASVAAGTLSRESAMAREGVQDVAAEMARIRRDPSAELSAITQRATAFATLVGQGADIEGAALAVGFDADVAAQLLPDLTNSPNPDDTGNNPPDPTAPPDNNPPTPPTPTPAPSRRQRQKQGKTPPKKPAGGPPAAGA